MGARWSDDPRPLPHAPKHAAQQTPLETAALLALFAAVVTIAVLTAIGGYTVARWLA